jgi:dTDP-4-dehydrorhamnose reductase
MRIAVTGKHGQVAQSLIERAALAGHEVLPLGRPEFDLTRPDGLEALLAALRPDAVVSAAAYTAVDKAESEPELAHAANALGPAALARAAAALDLPLVHLSTDYVFDGAGARPYQESDPVAPLGVYGRTKLAGEAAVLAAHPGNSAILRTAWVFSPFGSNFAKTMLRLAADRDELGVVGDQVGNPTNAIDIADGILRVAENLMRDRAANLRGVFHMTAAGETSWAGFAKAIFAASRQRGGPHAAVREIATADYPTPARRPANSRLDCSQLAKCHQVRLPDWQTATGQIVARLVPRN